MPKCSAQAKVHAATCSAQAGVHAATKVIGCYFFGPSPIKDNTIPDDVTAMGRNGLSKIKAPVTAISDRRAQPLPGGSKSPPTKMPVEVVDPPERTLLPDATEVYLVWFFAAVTRMRPVAVVPKPKIRAVPLHRNPSRSDV